MGNCSSSAARDVAVPPGGDPDHQDPLLREKIKNLNADDKFLYRRDKKQHLPREISAQQAQEMRLAAPPTGSRLLWCFRNSKTVKIKPKNQEPVCWNRDYVLCQRTDQGKRGLDGLSFNIPITNYYDLPRLTLDDVPGTLTHRQVCVFVPKYWPLLTRRPEDVLWLSDFQKSFLYWNKREPSMQEIADHQYRVAQLFCDQCLKSNSDSDNSSHGEVSSDGSVVQEYKQNIQQHAGISTKMLEEVFSSGGLSLQKVGKRDRGSYEHDPYALHGGSRSASGGDGVFRPKGSSASTRSARGSRARGGGGGVRGSGASLRSGGSYAGLGSSVASGSFAYSHGGSQASRSVRSRPASGFGVSAPSPNVGRGKSRPSAGMRGHPVAPSDASVSTAGTRHRPSAGFSTGSSKRAQGRPTAGLGGPVPPEVQAERHHSSSLSIPGIPGSSSMSTLSLSTVGHHHHESASQATAKSKRRAAAGLGPSSVTTGNKSRNGKVAGGKHSTSGSELSSDEGHGARLSAAASQHHDSLDHRQHESTMLAV